MRFDIGGKYGLLSAQIALALNGQDRDEMLTRLLELLMTRSMQEREGPGSARRRSALRGAVGR